MAQMTTYGNPRVSEADKIAAAERARENKSLAEQQQREVALTIANAEINKVAAEIVLEKEKGQPVDTPAQVVEDSRLADAEALYDSYIDRREQLYKNFYRFSPAWVNCILEFAPLSLEMDKACRVLGRTNPMTDGIMHVGDGSGVIQDPLRHIDAVCDMFKRRFRATGSVNREDFEAGRSV